jgi:SAM-dependent methyltransferase
MPIPWPKSVPELTPAQRAIQDDWMRYWHEVLPSRHSRVKAFDHTYPLRSARPGDRTLEIGAGLGEHLRYEQLDDQEFHAIELRETMAEALRGSFPEVHAVVGDCQERLPFGDGSLDRVIAIQVLEHLPDLPSALDEVQRVLVPGGRLAVVIPCEGGLGYALGRRVTSQRLFERRYNTSYGWHIRSDHVNVPSEIFEELRARFDISDRQFFPLRIPTIHLNLTVGLTCVRR